MKLFIFGSTGDLVKRKVLPALNMMREKNLEVYAFGRKDFTDEVYRDFVCSDEEVCSPYFRKHLHYHQLDFETDDICLACTNLLDEKEVNYFYVSLPPNMFDKIFRALGRLNKEGYPFKALVEKPFGDSQSSAQKLKDLLKEHQIIDHIWLSDHYLFKKNILSLKKKDFKNMKIVALEKVGLEGRAGYYEGIGALKDMVQSHFLQIAFKILEEPQEHFSEFEITHHRRGQYGDGKEEGYVKDLGKPSDTETFVHHSLQSKGRSFEFITGKGFAEKESYLEIDGLRIDLEGGDNPYIALFERFLRGDKEGFPSIEHAILAWKIIESSKDAPQLFYYPKGSSSEQVLNHNKP